VARLRHGVVQALIEADRPPRGSNAGTTRLFACHGRHAFSPGDAGGRRDVNEKRPICPPLLWPFNGTRTSDCCRQPDPNAEGGSNRLTVQGVHPAIKIDLKTLHRSSF